MRKAAPIVLLALIACKNESTFNEVPSTIEVVPDLSDPGDVAVGSVVPLTVQIAHVGGGPVTVSIVDVRNLDGEFFSFDGSLPILVDVGEVQSFDVVYAPTEPGWHHAAIDIVSTALESQITVDARAHAVIGVPALRPLLLDFGPLGPGQHRDADLIVLNEGSIDIELLGADFSASGFEVLDGFPITIPAEDETTVPIRFTAEDASPITATADFDFGGPDTPTVQLRANDCQNGTSELYDTDNDGWTSCSGDCNDSSNAVNPGKEEVVDAVDQDCDGLVDEGTNVFDDDGDCRCEGAVCTGSVDATCTSVLGSDCNDGADKVSPAIAEIQSNGIDDDCDGQVDQGSADDDGDGYSAVGGDCNDADAATFPGAIERADGKDNDCDTIADEGTAAFDDDGDGQTESGGDCDDSEPAMKAGGVEVPDRLDNDCDGSIDEGTTFSDDDGDGFNEVAGDCDDANPARNPGEYDFVGNSIDEDCKGSTGP